MTSSLEKLGQLLRATHVEGLGHRHAADVWVVTSVYVTLQRPDVYSAFALGTSNV